MVTTSKVHREDSASKVIYHEVQRYRSQRIHKPADSDEASQFPLIFADERATLLLQLIEAMAKKGVQKNLLTEAEVEQFRIQCRQYLCVTSCQVCIRSLHVTSLKDCLLWKFFKKQSGTSYWDWSEESVEKAYGKEAGKEVKRNQSAKKSII